MDWNYWSPDSWGAFTFDTLRFSDPKGMIDTIHAQHAKIMISCWPKYYLTTDNMKELDQMGKIYQQSIKDSLYDWLGYKYAFYDAYDLDARKVFWRQLYEKLATIGMDAWWMDASEPNVRDCTDLPYRKLLCGPTALGSSDEYFNAYSIVNAEAIYDGQRGYETAIERQGIKADDSQALQKQAKWNQYGYGNEDAFSPDNQRVFLLTRNGFAAEQRFSTATWSGDIGTRWEDMKTQITAGLNWSRNGTRQPSISTMPPDVRTKIFATGASSMPAGTSGASSHPCIACTDSSRSVSLGTSLPSRILPIRSSVPALTSAIA